MTPTLYFFLLTIYFSQVHAQCAFFANNCIFPSDGSGYGSTRCYLEGRSGNETLHKSPTNEPHLDEVLAQIWDNSPENKGCATLSTKSKLTIYLVRIF